jgi:hypothetical protein
VLTYGFTENCQFGAKTDWNSVFLDRDPRIANRLSITVPHFNFYGFWKISHFCSKSKGVSLRFYRKLPVWGQKLTETPYFLVVTPYCESVIYNDLVFQFLRVWKFSHFCSESKGVSVRFYRKLPVWGKNWMKLRISSSWPLYCKSVIYNGPVFQFLRVLKNFTFLLEIQRCSLRFYRKLLVWSINWSKLRISWSWPPYCESVIYNGPVFQFLRVLKNFTFLLEI